MHVNLLSLSTQPTLAGLLSVCLSSFLNTHTHSASLFLSISLSSPLKYPCTKLHSKSNLNLLELRNLISRKCAVGQFCSEWLAEVQIQASKHKNKKKQPTQSTLQTTQLHTVSNKTRRLLHTQISVQLSAK